GPEIVAATLAAAPAHLLAQLVIYGDHGPLERGARAMGVTLPGALQLRTGDGLGDGAIAGDPDERSGAAQVQYLEAAVAAAKRGEVAGLVTAPISKTWAK